MNKDPRTAEERKAHEAFAKATLQHTNQRILQLLEKPPANDILLKMPTLNIEAARLAASSNESYSYTAQMDFANLFGGVVNLFPEGYPPFFKGFYGGLGVGLGSTWGTCFFNFDLKSLDKVIANFEFNIAPAFTQINFWKLVDGSFIGHFIGGGVAFGLGVYGGQGSWSDHREWQ